MKLETRPGVILIAGGAGSGKDTVGKFLAEELQTRGYSVLITHFADLLKYICKTFLNWNGVKDKNGRTMLQHVGTDLIREREPDFFVNFITFVLKLFPDAWDYVIIPDWRFENEATEFYLNGFRPFLINVERNALYKIYDKDHMLTDEQEQHSSEHGLDGLVDFDFNLDNSSSLKVAETIVKYNVVNKIENFYRS